MRDLNISVSCFQTFFHLQALGTSFAFSNLLKHPSSLLFLNNKNNLSILSDREEVALNEALSDRGTLLTYLSWIKYLQEGEDRNKKFQVEALLAY